MAHNDVRLLLQLPRDKDVRFDSFMKTASFFVLLTL